jgi:hypothetical protein
MEDEASISSRQRRCRRAHGVLEGVLFTFKFCNGG